MDVELPDGRVVVGVPDGMTKAELTVKLRNNGLLPEPEEKVAASIPGRFFLGAASLPMGAAQLASHVSDSIDPLNKGDNKNSKAMDTWIQRLEDMKAKGGAKGFDVAGLIGSLATPVGAGGKVIKPATGWIGKTAQSATTGAGIGAATPVVNTENYDGDKLAQMGLGGLFGGALAPIAGAMKGAYNVIEPHLPGGPARGAGRAIADVVGDKYPEILKALRTRFPEQVEPTMGAPSKTPVLSAGEAAIDAGSAEFSGLQSIVAKHKPSEYSAMEKAQQDTRDELIGQIAGSPKQLDVAKAERKAASDPLYKSAREGIEIKSDQALRMTAKGPIEEATRVAQEMADRNGQVVKLRSGSKITTIKPRTDVNVLPILTHIDELIENNPGNAPLLRELNGIKKGLVDENGLPRSKPGEIASTLDGLKTSIANKDNTYIREQLTAIKTKLVDAIPNYKAAQDVYAAKSKPVNRLEIGKVLQDRLNSPLGIDERASTFARAVNEAPKTITNATGNSRFNDLAQILEPDELSAVNRVAEELTSRAKFEKSAQAGTSAAREKLGSSLAPTQVPGVLDRGVMVVRAVIDRMSGKASKEALDHLATVMQDPKKTAALMEAADPAQKNALVALLAARAVPTISMGASSATARHEGGLTYSGGH